MADRTRSNNNIGPDQLLKTILIARKDMIKHPESISSIDWAHWQPDLLTTLVFIRQQQQVLLIHKKTGLGAGIILGPGGKLEVGETPLACAIRETQEELTITPHNLEPMAELFFHDLDSPKIIAYVYIADEYSGTPKETLEAAPIWCPMDDLPLDAMWADDQFWLPQVLRKEPIRGWFYFRGEHLVDHRLESVAVSF